MKDGVIDIIVSLLLYGIIAVEVQGTGEIIFLSYLYHT